MGCHATLHVKRFRVLKKNGVGADGGTTNFECPSRSSAEGTGHVVYLTVRTVGLNMEEKLLETYQVFLEQSRIMLDSWPQAVVIVLVGILLWGVTRLLR